MDNLKQHLSPEELALATEYLNKKQPLPTEIQKHINSCAACKYEVMAVLELSDFDVVQTDRAIWLNRNLLFSLAAVALILLAIGMYWILLPQQNRPESQLSQYAVQTSDSLSTTMDSVNQIEDEIAVELPEKIVLAQANFTPNNNLEQLVARYQTQLRSTETSAVSVKKMADGFRISWAAKGQISFELFNNQDVLLKSWETDEQFIDFKPEMNGLYYFKLINEEFDLLWVGKLEVH